MDGGQGKPWKLRERGGKDNKIEEEEEERNYRIIVKAQEGERVS